jgi:DNA polymerase III sliding clamp (beta) subunit (PCNA family)
MDATKITDLASLDLALDLKRLQTGLGPMVDALYKRRSLPVLKHILLEVKGSKATFSAINMDLAYSFSIACDWGAKEGSLLIPGKVFIDGVKKLDASKSELCRLEVSNDGRKLLLRHGRATTMEFDVQCADGFPTLVWSNGMGAPQRTEVALDRLGKVFARGLAGCQSGTISNPTSLHLLAKRDGFGVFGTDGHILALASTPTPRNENVGADGEQLHVDYRLAAFMGRMARAFRKDDADVQISWDDRSVFFESHDGAWKFSTRRAHITDRQLSKVTDVTEFAHSFYFDRRELNTALKFLAINMGEYNHEVDIAFGVNEVGCPYAVLSHYNTDDGTTYDATIRNTDIYVGPAYTGGAITLRQDKLKRMMKAVNGDSVFYRFNDNQTVGVFTEVGQDDDVEFSYYILPVQDTKEQEQEQEQTDTTEQTDCIDPDQDDMDAADAAYAANMEYIIQTINAAAAPSEKQNSEQGVTDVFHLRHAPSGHYVSPDNAWTKEIGEGFGTWGAAVAFLLDLPECEREGFEIVAMEVVPKDVFHIVHAPSSHYVSPDGAWTREVGEGYDNFGGAIAFLLAIPECEREGYEIVATEYMMPVALAA